MPKIALTSAQMKALLERVLAREARGSMHQPVVPGIDPLATRGPVVGQIPPPEGSYNAGGGVALPPLDPGQSGALRAMKMPPAGPFQPAEQLPPAAIPQMGPSPLQELEMAMDPREVALTRLYKAREGEPLAINLPREEAKAMYLANPEGFSRGYQPPPSLRIRTVAAGGPEDMTGDLAKGLAFERLKFYPPLTAAEQGKMALAEMGAQDVGLSLPKAEALSEAEQMASLWQKMGGRRGEKGKFWELLRSSSRAASKIKDPRDYFISSGTAWRKNPKEFSQKHPREAKHLAEAWKKYME